MIPMKEFIDRLGNDINCDSVTIIPLNTGGM